MVGDASNGFLRNGFLFSSDGGAAYAMTANAGNGDNGVFLDYENGGENSDSVNLYVVPSSPPRLSSSGNYIEHMVSRFDTLAGVAIRYGVEVWLRVCLRVFVLVILLRDVGL